MDNRTSWIAARVRLGWIFLAGGVVVVLVGILSEINFSYAPFNLRLITGLGIFLGGIGIGYLVRYRGALKDEPSRRRLTAEERDERTLMIRNRGATAPTSYRPCWSISA